MDSSPAPDSNQPASQPETGRSHIQEYLLNQQTAPNLSTLTLGLLHKFNNLITGIMFLSDEAYPGEEDDAERLQQIGRSIREAHRYVDRVIRLHLSDADDEITYHGLARLIESDFDLFSILLPKGVPIRYSTSSESVSFYGSQRALREILLHLFANAGEVLQKGSGIITLNVAERENAQGNSEAVIVLRDNGPGIPDAILPRLFEPFTTSKDPANHLGLGLYRSRQLARAMRSELTGANHPEGGVEFTLVLPQSGPDSEE
jgi:signal transduction histidine kinase